jgi:hypothetical protein
LFGETINNLQSYYLANKDGSIVKIFSDKEFTDEEQYEIEHDSEGYWLCVEHRYYHNSEQIKSAHLLFKLDVAK